MLRTLSRDPTAYLPRHAVLADLAEHEGLGVEKPVPAVVGEASNQFSAGGHA